jgi:hypothetical protein
MTIAAVLHGFQCVAQHLVSTGNPVEWDSPVTFRVRKQQWQLLPDLGCPVPSPWDVAVSWSGLIWCRPPLRLPTAERSSLSVLHLNGAAQWIHLSPEARWCAIHRTEAGAPPMLRAVPVLCTILRHILGPATTLLGPDAHMVGCMPRGAAPGHPLTPPPRVPTTLVCGDFAPPHAPGAGPCPISILPHSEALLSHHLQVLVLPAVPSFAVYYTAGQLPLRFRCTLDALFPPPPTYCAPPLWTHLALVGAGSAPDHEPGHGSDTSSDSSGSHTLQGHDADSTPPETPPPSP